MITISGLHVPGCVISLLDSLSSKMQATVVPVADLGRENIPLVIAGLFISVAGFFFNGLLQ